MAEKQLASSTAAGEYQKRWFAQLRQEVFEERAPYAIVQADMPFELFQVMGIPVVSNQWWAAVLAAKRLAPAYLDGLEGLGYHDGLCRYCSLGMAASLCPDAGDAPWGGLPRPALLAARLTCDCVQRVFATWACAWGCEFFALDNPGATALPPRWWESSRHHWRELFEPHRLAFTASQLRALIRILERVAGRDFDLAALRVLMERVNEQEACFEEALNVICTAPRTPVRMHEQIVNVMAAQWVRGSDWAVSHARRFRDEVRARAAAGTAACPDERLRLMWVGAGLWHDTDFYTSFEAEYGAVFVWSMYLAFGPDGYIRYGLDDPLAALASRTVSMNEQLHNPPWAGEWVVEQARRHRIDGALLLMPLGTRPAATGRRFIEAALERAGVPVLRVDADMVDARQWHPGQARERVRAFIEHRLLTGPRRARTTVAEAR